MAFATLHDRKAPLPAADLLNDRVAPFFDSAGILLLHVLTDRGTEYCGNPEHREYELYLALEDMDHARRRKPAGSSNGSTRPCSTSSIASPCARWYMRAGRHDQAAGARGAGVPSIAGVPYLKGIPFRSRSIFSALRTFPQVCSAASIRSKAIPRQVGRERQLLVQLVR